MKEIQLTNCQQHAFRQFLSFLDDTSYKVYILKGYAGTGKTTFVQGLAAALGVSGRVTSPTFCIVQEHMSAGNAKLFVHMDLYRLESEADVIAIGWEDYIDRGAILAVEWPERAGSLIPQDAIRVSFSRLEDEDSRRIKIS